MSKFILTLLGFIGSIMLATTSFAAGSCGDAVQGSNAEIGAIVATSNGFLDSYRDNSARKERGEGQTLPSYAEEWVPADFVKPALSQMVSNLSTMQLELDNLMEELSFNDPSLHRIRRAHGAVSSLNESIKKFIDKKNYDLKSLILFSDRYITIISESFNDHFQKVISGTSNKLNYKYYVYKSYQPLKNDQPLYIQMSHQPIFQPTTNRTQRDFGSTVGPLGLFFPTEKRLSSRDRFLTLANLAKPVFINYPIFDPSVVNSWIAEGPNPEAKLGILEKQSRTRQLSSGATLMEQGRLGKMLPGRPRIQWTDEALENVALIDSLPGLATESYEKQLKQFERVNAAIMLGTAPQSVFEVMTKSGPGTTESDSQVAELRKAYDTFGISLPFESLKWVAMFDYIDIFAEHFQQYFTLHFKPTKSLFYLQQWLETVDEKVFNGFTDSAERNIAYKILETASYEGDLPLITLGPEVLGNALKIKTQYRSQLLQEHLESLGIDRSSSNYAEASAAFVNVAQKLGEILKQSGTPQEFTFQYLK